MIMKNNGILALSLVLFLMSISTVSGQTTDTKEIKVQKRTLVEKFEPDFVIPIEERIALKERRIIQQRTTKRILDTLDISDRKRRKLIRELRRSPFSERIAKTILAETEFQDEISEVPEQ